MAEYEVGKKYKVKKANGNEVERLCVAEIEDKFQKEQDKVREQNGGFAPMFVKDGYVWLSLTPCPHEYSEATKKLRAAKKEAKEQVKAAAREVREKAREKKAKEREAEMKVNAEKRAQRKKDQIKRLQEKLANLKE